MVISEPTQHQEGDEEMEEREVKGEEGEEVGQTVSSPPLNTFRGKKHGTCVIVHIALFPIPYCIHSVPYNWVLTKLHSTIHAKLQ